jgi:hypothetical protein
MSKIMRALYEQARVARETVAPAYRRETDGALDRPLSFDSSRASGVEWWQTQYERGGRARVSKVTDAAIYAIQLPCTPAAHAKWWRERMVARVDLK